MIILNIINHSKDQKNYTQVYIIINFGALGRPLLIELQSISTYLALTYLIALPQPTLWLRLIHRGVYSKPKCKYQKYNSNDET